MDKLEEYEKAQENKILTYLGINNVDNEKKEHLIVDEVNANNQFIQANGDNFVDNIQEFFDRMNDTFGFELSIELKNKPVEIQQESEENNNVDKES